MRYKSYRKGQTKDLPLASASKMLDCIRKTEKYLYSYPLERTSYEIFEDHDLSWPVYEGSFETRLLRSPA